jgi:hypothetical protein
MLKLKDEEVLHILEEQLPEMIERDPDLERRAFRAFLRVFTTKEETAAILAEMREFRGEFRRFSAKTDQRFEQIDQRFEQIDRRFEQIDRRFEEIDRRFEQIDRRFEEIDRRFEHVDQRFEEVDRRLEGLQQEMSDLRDWVEGVVGGLQRRSGRRLEDVVAGALRVALRRPDIKPDQLRLRQRMVDEKGVVGLPGQRRFEIDILAQDGQISVFEVKSYCEWEDIDRLHEKVAFVQALNPGVKVEGIMIAMSIGDEVRERCQELGITLVYHGD